MSLRDRLRRLEGDMPAPCCAYCVTWPPARVVFPNDWDGERREPATPERCSRCGFEPITVVVEYVNDWRPLQPDWRSIRP
jgi:hypothetical protein